MHPALGVCHQAPKGVATPEADGPKVLPEPVKCSLILGL